MGNGGFSLPSGGGGLNTYIQPTPYVRPADWLPIRQLVSAGQQKIVILHKVVDHDSNYCAFSVTCSTGSYFVDWGDGTNSTTASATASYHQYNFAATPSNTTTSFGYRQVIITITPLTGNLTVFNGNIKHNQVGLSAYTTGYLDMVVAGASLISTNLGALTMNVVHTNLEQYEFVGTNNMTSCAYMFNTCNKLKNVIMPSITSVTTCQNMFNNCNSLRSAPMMILNTTTGVILTSMFNGCNSLEYVPLYDTRTATSFATMFNLCYSLQVCPFFDTRAGTAFNSMFTDCKSLIKVPPFNLISATTLSSMFDGCASLVSTPSFTTSNVTAINLSLMFVSCSSLTTVGLFNTGGCTNFSDMFNACISLQTVPLFDMGNATNVTSMFASCYSLQSVPQFNTIKVTTFTSMFASCYSLTTVPQFDMRAATATNSMFASCFSLINLPDPLSSTATPNLTSVSSMFQNCESLLSVPFIDTSRAASFNLMFSGCVSLLRIPNLDTSLVTSWTSAFNGCDSLERIPALNMVVANTMTTTFSGCASIGSNKMFNIGVSFGVGAEKLSKTNLEEIFDNMLRNNVTATITITTNPGADTAVVKTISITAGQTVITPPNMTGIVNGMWVTGPNIGNTTFDISGTTLTKTAHGLPDGTKVAFLSTTGVSGATNRTIYYVVNGTADTIQLSTTYPAVTLVPITGTGTGSLGYPVQIIAVGGSTYTIDKPVGTTGSGSISHRLLNTTYAVLKGWTVTG